MKRIYVPVIALLIALIVYAVTAQTKSKRDTIARGMYIVSGVALCGGCHTPMKGMKPDMTKQLSGAPIWFKPTIEMPHWKMIAPSLRQGGELKEWKDEQVQTFLMTGKTPHGHMAEPPMPQFRMNEYDAAAVTAYLRSLKPIPAK